MVSKLLIVTASAALLAAATPVTAADFAAPIMASSATSSAVDRFFSARKNVLLWMPNREAQVTLLQLLRDAPVDGFARGPALAAQIETSIAAAQTGDAAAAKAADRMMSSALVDYVQALHAPIPGMTYGDNWVRPRSPTGETVLAIAARAPSLADHVKTVWNLNPVYAGLRQAAVAEASLPNGGQSALLARNMTRARFTSPSSRFVLVDIVSARLWMYENGVPVDSMKVVVGKNELEKRSGNSLQTPMITSVMYYTIFNPYWHMPDHLVPNMAKAVLQSGTKVLAGNKYEVVDSWSAKSIVLDPKTVDWKAVLAGTAHVKLRQKPTGANSMGKMKFPFENGLGIYLHDTPHPEYFAKADRTLSNGCVRLEDAARFGSWLMRRPARPESTNAELTVAFPQGVPIYMTYLTARPDAGKIAYMKDVYGWDKAASGSAVALNAN